MPFFFKSKQALAQGVLDVFRREIPMESGNLRYNATTLKDYKESYEGLSFRINISSRKAHYAEWVLKGRHDKQGNLVQKPNPFIERGLLKCSDFIKSSLGSKKYLRKKASQLRHEHRKLEVDNLLRQQRLSKSIAIDDYMQMKPGFERRETNVYKQF